ncbi:glycosyltransferase [Candidatus Mancarchaeum acidiphilum]|uniref:Glycosyltransferase n=1 Tax=Candidatus Mancarchaeum acidiphilum TaxID=1920749 RepID=A0A218NN24_9ARCH|nr:glycosyltransferase family 4 protein [Candidatus Mancarchaeum acidiphilum]ASI13869.1 glycosyltransferase [Candidatus Mancarchaeum acidiphilum]
MTKIAFVSDVAYPWVKGGMESIQYLEMKNLSEKNDVYCFCLQFEKMKKEFDKEGIHYITVAKASVKDLYTSKGSRSIKLAMKFARALPRAIKDYNFDFIYANTFPYLHLKYVKSYCRSHNCILALDVAEVWDLKRWKGYLGTLKGTAAYRYAKNAIHGADYYVANSSVTASQLNSVGIKPNKIKILSPVLDLKIRVKKSKRDTSVVYSGRLIKEKRLDLWIDAVAKAHSLNPNIKGIIIGSGPEETHIRDLASSYDFIKMRKPYATKLWLYNELRRSMCFLNMSEREGLSITTIESAFLETPPLLPDYTPIPDEVKEISIVKSLNSIPEAIVDIASGKINYKLDKDKLKKFDITTINPLFERLIRKRKA